MLNKITRFAGAAYAVIAISNSFSYAKERKHDSDTKSTLLFTSTIDGGMGACASPIHVSQVVRVALDPGNPVRNVFSNIPDPNGNEVSHDKPSYGKPMGGGPEPYDVDIKGSVVTANAYTMVRVVLTNTAYKFVLITDQDSGSQINGVGLGDPNNDLELCGNTIEKNAINWTAVFYIPNDSAQTPDGTASQINVIIQPNGSPGTPFYIDPKVKNGG